LRRELLGQGATHGTGEEQAWRRALVAAEGDIATMLDISLRSVVGSALKSAPSRRLAEVLAAIAPELDRMDALAARLSALAGEDVTLKAKVTGPRLGPLVGAVFSGFDARDRQSLVKEVEALIAVLGKAGLRQAIAPEFFLEWTAGALLRGDVLANEGAAPERYDYDNYRTMRAAEQRVSSAYTLAEIALVVAPELVSSSASPAEATSVIASLCARLPDDVRARVVEGDLARVRRALQYLENFWEKLEEKNPGGEAWLEELVRSKYFDILWDESALTRFALEARNVAEVFPGHAAEVLEVRARLGVLDEKTRGAVAALFQRRADEAWAKALSPGAT